MRYRHYREIGRTRLMAFFLGTPPWVSLPLTAAITVLILTIMRVVGL